MTERITIDPEIAALCDAAACWLADIGTQAAELSLTAAQWISLVSIPAAWAGVSESAWVECVGAQASAFGFTLAQGFAAQLRARREAARRLAAAPTVLHTGYAPEPERRTTRHRLYSARIRKPKPRITLADRVRAEDVAFGLIESR